MTTIDDDQALQTRPAAPAPWIRTIRPDEATGGLAESYEAQREVLGRVTELTQLGSLHPPLVALRLDFYAAVNDTPSEVPDHVRRAVALLTSVINECLFCTIGHTEKLTEAGYGALAQAIGEDPDGVRTGDDAIDVILAYTRTLVRTPGKVAQEQVEALRDAGWTDLDILDVNNLAAYYCYINRVAAGLGLQGPG